MIENPEIAEEIKDAVMIAGGFLGATPESADSTAGSEKAEIPNS